MHLEDLIKDIPKELMDQVYAEINNPEYEGKSHYSKNTYYRYGCRGILCTAAERHQTRDRPARLGSHYPRRLHTLDQYLGNIIIWYQVSRKLEKALKQQKQVS